MTTEEKRQSIENSGYAETFRSLGTDLQNDHTVEFVYGLVDNWLNPSHNANLEFLKIQKILEVTKLTKELESIGVRFSSDYQIDSPYDLTKYSRRLNNG